MHGCKLLLTKALWLAIQSECQYLRFTRFNYNMQITPIIVQLKTWLINMTGKPHTSSKPSIAVSYAKQINMNFIDMCITVFSGMCKIANLSSFTLRFSSLSSTEELIQFFLYFWKTHFFSKAPYHNKANTYIVVVN